MAGTAAAWFGGPSLLSPGVRWSWVAASCAGGLNLALLAYDTGISASHVLPAILLAVSYPLVMLPMFLLRSLLLGRLGSLAASTALAVLALLFCSALLEVTALPVERVLTFVWVVALAAAVAFTGADAVHRRVIPT